MKLRKPTIEAAELRFIRFRSARGEVNFGKLGGKKI